MSRFICWFVRLDTLRYAQLYEILYFEYLLATQSSSVHEKQTHHVLVSKQNRMATLNRKCVLVDTTHRYCDEERGRQRVVSWMNSNIQFFQSFFTLVFLLFSLSLISLHLSHPSDRELRNSSLRILDIYVDVLFVFQTPRYIDTEKDRGPSRGLRHTKSGRRPYVARE